MFGKISVALLLISAPALAQEAPPADPQADEAVSDPKPAPYKIKKVCRPVEVVGSAIPRMVCQSKRIYLKPDEEAKTDDKSQPAPDSQI